MTSKLTGRPILSGFTINMLTNSGWYLVNDSIRENLIWGYQKGCGFLNDQCTEIYKEFCSTSDQMNCTVDFSGKTICDSDKYTDNCKINAFLSAYQCDSNDNDTVRTNEYEIFGKHSRCLVMSHANERHTGCYQTECDVSMSKITIKFKDGEFTSKIECTSQNEKVFIDESRNLSIICPDPREFCSKSGVLNCQNDCSGKGSCKSDKTCFCDILFTNEDCSEHIPCNDDLCQKLIKQQSSVSILKNIIFMIFFILTGL